VLSGSGAMGVVSGVVYASLASYVLAMLAICSLVSTTGVAVVSSAISVLATSTCLVCLVEIWRSERGSVVSFFGVSSGVVVCLM